MSPAHIYVVDGDATIRRMLQDILDSQGYRSTLDVADDGTFARLWAARPTLVIIDICAIDATGGRRLVQQLQREASTSKLPLILTSTDAALLDTLEAGLATSAIRTLKKPFAVPALLAMIAALHRQPQ